MRQVKIGLALGSGAAKGWAHIGVINALEKAGIKVDVVAGCSVGALVGAAYVSNHMPLLETWVRSFSYWDVICLMDFSWHRGGLLRGERVFNHVRRLIKYDHIEQCVIPFGVVTTNLSTGRELWLTEGDLHQAIRASCSMPGLLAPVGWNGYWLVDGAVVNPVPISLTRALGADIVIAVDLQLNAAGAVIGHASVGRGRSHRSRNQLGLQTEAKPGQSRAAQSEPDSGRDGNYVHFYSGVGKPYQALPYGGRSA